MAVQRDDPYRQFNFIVEIDGFDDGSHGGFSEISGIGFETTVIEYRTGTDKDNGVRKLPGLTKYTNITLKRGVIGSLAFYQWLRSSADGAADSQRNVAISLLSEDRGTVGMRWLLRRARIIKHTSGPFNARGTDVAMEEMVLAYERLEIE